MEKLVNFFFTKSDGASADYLLKVYKDDVYVEDLAVDGDNNPLRVVVDNVSTTDASAGMHTLKFKVVQYGADDDNEFPSAELDRIVIDDVVHSDADDIFADDLKVYTPVSSDISQGIADGTIHSDEISTHDLGLGDGNQSYSISSPWNNGGLGKINTVYVFTYQEPFSDWYDTKGSWS